MDESGHDHSNTPLEVRGGVAIHASRVWGFVSEFNNLELEAFGFHRADRGLEVKGEKLLDRKRLGHADQEPELDAVARCKGADRFVTRSQQKLSPTRREFTAYGQACRLMAKRTLGLLERHEACLFASAIPRGARKPRDYRFDHFLRKDHVFLQERFYWFLERHQEHGLFVMDQTEKLQDKRFIRRLHDYYTKTKEGRQRSRWIVPAPIFVDSELSPGVQAADLCIYCINWGFRRAEWDFHGDTREDIQRDFAGLCGRLQYRGTAVNNGGEYKQFGIVYVPDPYEPRARTA
jgi:hypothetical protein